MRRYVKINLAIFSILILSCIFYLYLGPIKIPFTQVFTCILTQRNAGPCMIVNDLRLPRMIATIIGGAALSIAGLILQFLFRNPIVGPWILGIESGTILFVAMVLILGTSLNMIALLHPWGLLTAGVTGALLVTLIMLVVAALVRSVVTVLLIGIMIGYICGAITDFLKAFAQSWQIHALAMWVLGTFSLVTWHQLNVMLPVTMAGLMLALPLAKPLNAVLLGEDYARSLGVNIKLVRVLSVLSASLLTAGIIVFTGPIAFIGLAVPHIARLMFKTSDARRLLLPTILLGALITELCDLCARTVLMPVELPINSVTSLIGAPILILLLLKRRVEYD